MANRNHGLVNNGTDNKETGKESKKLIQINWKKIAKTGGKIAVGFCALVGAAGLGSYAADQIGKPKQVSGSHPVDVKITDV